MEIFEEGDNLKLRTNQTRCHFLFLNDGRGKETTRERKGKRKNQLIGRAQRASKMWKDQKENLGH
jgi:hypothetical protein